jgi:hypothetical protein
MAHEITDFVVAKIMCDDKLSVASKTGIAKARPMSRPVTQIIAERELRRWPFGIIFVSKTPNANTVETTERKVDRISVDLFDEKFAAGELESKKASRTNKPITHDDASHKSRERATIP